MKRFLCAVSSLALSLALAASAFAAAPAPRDWPVFGGNVEHTSVNSAPTGISAANVNSLHLQQVSIPGTVDASAIFLHGVRVKGATHNVFFVTTTYGKTVAIDAGNGSILWTYTPADYSVRAGTAKITNSTPVADPDREYVYAASPDGDIQKLAIADGHAVWRTPITLFPLREKMDSPLTCYRGHIIAVTAGYVGDRPPYQGHVAVLDASTGKLLHVWNSLCSNRTGLIQPSSCSASDSAIWGRAGAVIDPQTGDIFVATGNGPWNGTSNWGDAVIELNSSATRMLGNYTPINTDYLNRTDRDIGSTSPVLLGDGYLAQGGKDDLIRILKISNIQGTAPHKGREIQIVSTPSGNMLFTAPAVWHHNGATWMFAADGEGTAAWTFSGGRLQQKWKNENGGTSPFLADGLLYVYNPGGSLRVYQAATGHQVANLPCAQGHWNSPIVVDGMIALPVGNANAHRESGTFDIWRVH